MSNINKGILDEYGSFPTAVLSLIKGKVMVMGSEIKPLCENSQMVGTAYTINEEENCIDMINEVKPGQVIVIAAGGHRESSIWGWFSNFSAICRKTKGIVIDGSVSGIKSLRQSEIPIFASNITPMIGGHRSEARVNIQIKCGGVQVNPGDLVIGDDDGVVVVPYDEVIPVAKAAKEIIQVLDFVKEEMIREKKPLDQVRNIYELYKKKNSEQFTYWQFYGSWFKKYGRRQ